MAMGMLVGGIFLGTVGAKVARNYFSTDEDTKAPVADVQRKYGVTERIMANPKLLEHYNEKYIQKKLSNNSAMKMQAEKIQIARTNSLIRTASTKKEEEQHVAALKQMTVPQVPAAVIGA